MKERVLPQTFYARDPRLVARELLGKVLVRTLSNRAGAQRLSGRIVEAEVYLGEGDLAGGPVLAEVRVALRCGDALVAQKFLNAP